jgi:hypothetical protein
MKSICVLVALAACSRSQRAIDTVNPVIGDTSFIRAFGRFPTPADDATLRARTHVGYVAALLRTHDAPSPELRTQRARLLDELDRYVAAGEFPTSETDTGLLPTFLDARSGVRCAVADLVEFSAGTAIMTALDRDHHNDYIADIAADPRFAAWADRSGFTRDELAMIQPSYSPQPRHHVELDIAASYAVAVDDHDAGMPFQIGLVGASLRRLTTHSDCCGVPYVELDAAIGAAYPTATDVVARGAIATDRTPLAYDAHVKLGSRLKFWPGPGSYHVAGVSAGIGVDRSGARIARAVTVPIDLWYRRHLSENALAGVHGGPRFAFGDRGTGWTAGVDAVINNLFVSNTDAGYDWAPRDLKLSVDVSRLADLVFVGASIGWGARTTHGYWGGE